MLITPLTGGPTMAVGRECMPVTLTGMLAGTAGIDGGKLWAAVERLQKATQAPDGGTQDGTPKAPRARRSKAGSAAAPAAAPAAARDDAK